MQLNKLPEWGSRFQFPENQQINFDSLRMSVTDKIVVQMVDNYEIAIASAIAQAARIAGASDVTVLNKAAIIDALMKRTPRKCTKNIDMLCCPSCGSDGIFFRRPSQFCPDCGQAIDWGADNLDKAVTENDCF